MSVSVDHTMSESSMVAGYCTTEQMDLWKQVFEEAAHRAAKSALADSGK
jgi:hypothetical protein